MQQKTKIVDQKVANLQLTEAENTDYKRCEETIARGLRTFVEVGTALAEIQSRLLYRTEYPTFELYCQERWGLGRGQAYRLINAAEVIKVLSPIGDILLPSNEAQAREVAKAPQEKWEEVMRKAKEKSKGSPITASMIESTVKEMSKPTKKNHKKQVNTYIRTPLNLLLSWIAILSDKIEKGETEDALRILDLARTGGKIEVEKA